MEYRDERSDAAKRKAEIDDDVEGKRQAKRERLNKALKQQAVERCWPDGAPWLPIDTMPFEAYGEFLSGSDRFFVSDGQSVEIATLTKRFGRPLHWVGDEPPQLVRVLTDNGFETRLEGPGEYKEPDWPEWMFEWQFNSATDTHVEYDNDVPDEVNFVPTHWLPMMPPVKAPE